MTVLHPILVAEIHAFLDETGMGKKYFGKASCGNSEVVARLETGGRVWPETEAKIRSFMMMRRKTAHQKDVSSRANVQAGKQKSAQTL